ncbi:MAG: hypothetical protein ACFCGT_02640 [Sandaracinaceae bacterium]
MRSFAALAAAFLLGLSGCGPGLLTRSDVGPRGDGGPPPPDQQFEVDEGPIEPVPMTVTLVDESSARDEVSRYDLTIACAEGQYTTPITDRYTTPEPVLGPCDVIVEGSDASGEVIARGEEHPRGREVAEVTVEVHSILLSTWSLWTGETGTHPGRIQPTAQGYQVDLSDMAGLYVLRATFDPHVAPSWTAWDPRWTAGHATSPEQLRYRITVGGVEQELLPPRYLTYDLTEVVRQAVADGQGSLEIVVEPGFRPFGPNVSLSVTVDAPAPAPLPQVEEVRATAAPGDTLLAFRELDPHPATMTYRELTDFLAANAPSEPGKRRYRVYRGPVPFDDVEAFYQAELIDEIGPFTGWNLNAHGADNDFERAGGCPPGRGGRCNAVVPTLPIDDETPAEPGTGIYVHRHDGPEERAYYFVSAVHGGAEDFASLDQGAPSQQGLMESEGPGLTLLARRESRPTWGGVSLPHERSYYVRWASPPYWNVPSQPFNYRVLRRQDRPSEGAPVEVWLHWLGAEFDTDAIWRRGFRDDPSLLVSANLVVYNSWTAFHESLGTLKAWEDGTVQPYLAARYLSFLFDFVYPALGADPTRTTMHGGSMGGAGTSFWGLRSGHLFSYLLADTGNSFPAEDTGVLYEFEGQGGYGPVSWNATYSNEQLERFGYRVVRPADGVSVWDYYDTEWWLANNPEARLPQLSLSNSSTDVVIFWPTAWRHARALAAAHAPFEFRWTASDHSSSIEDQHFLPYRSSGPTLAFVDGDWSDGLPEAPPPPGSTGRFNPFLRYRPDSITENETSLSFEVFVHRLLLPGDPPSADTRTDIVIRELSDLSIGSGTHAYTARRDGEVLCVGRVGLTDGLPRVYGIPVRHSPAEEIETLVEVVPAGSAPSGPTCPGSP